MSRRKVILPSWAVSSGTSKDMAALKERFPDLSNGELIINTKKENVSLTTLNESGETAYFIDESKTIELVGDALTNAKSYADSKVAEHDSAVTEVLKNYSKTSQIEEMVGAASAATLADVENKGYLTEHQSLEHLQVKIDDLDEIRLGAKSGATALQAVPEEYAKKTDIPSLDGYATTQWVESQIPSLEGYAKKSDIPTDYLKETDLDGYAEKTWVTEQIVSAMTGGEVDLTGYAKEEWVKEQGYLTSGSLDGYAKTNEIPTKTSDLTNDSGFITDIPDNVLTEDDLNGYATEEWVENQIPSLDGYATEEWVEGKKYLTSHQDLSDYAKKSDLGLSKPITSKGGVWSDVIRSVFGDTIPSGITFEDFLRRMAFAELWPENIETLTNLYIAIRNNPVSLSGITYGNSVEVGTEAFLKGITPSTFVVSGTVEITGMTYGYINPYTNEYTEDTSLSLSDINISEVSTNGISNNILNVMITGFTDNSGNTIENISTTGTVDDIKMYVADGTNKIVVSQKSSDYEISSTNEDIEIEYMSNMKDENSTSAYTTEIEYKSGNTEYTKTYTINSYRNTFYGVTSSTDECDAELIRSLTPTNYAVKTGNRVTFEIGETTGKRMIIASPLEIQKVWSPSLNQDITGYLTETYKTIAVPGANDFSPIDYHVYDCTWQNEFSKGNTWEIIFK